MRSRWWLRAACRGAPLEIFVTDSEGDESEDDPKSPPPEAKAYCDPCPVRVECLAWAMNHPDMQGVWGGTTTYQRRQLARSRERSKCLSCGSLDMIVSGTMEFCLSCGMSWWIL